MNINDKVLQVLDLLGSFVVVLQQLSHQFLLAFLKWNVVRASTKDVLEKTLQFVDIFVSLATKIECFNLLVFSLVLLFLLDLLFVAFLKVINDCIVMVAMLLPEFVQSVTFSLLDD